MSIGPQVARRSRRNRTPRLRATTQEGCSTSHGDPVVAAFAEQTADDVELAAVHKCIVAWQNILAGHAKNADAAMGITPTLKHVRRVSRGAGY